jgi:hypothetical protein
VLIIKRFVVVFRIGTAGHGAETLFFAIAVMFA